MLNGMQSRKESGLQCWVPGCYIDIGPNNWSHSNGHKIMYRGRMCCDSENGFCGHGDTCTHCHAVPTQQEESNTMNNNEKTMAALQAFADLVANPLKLVEVEKDGDEGTLRFGLENSFGDVVAVILTDTSKYTGVALGDSQARDSELLAE